MTLLHIVLGALAAAAVILGVRRWARNAWRTLGLALVIAAAILLVFAAWRGEARDVWLELSGVALFSMLAWWGRRRPLLVALGWLAHVPWDVLLHPSGAGGYVPQWYLGLCIGFDLTVGIYIAAMIGMGDHRGETRVGQAKRASSGE